MPAAETSEERMLVIGIGNEGRGDDGLGWRFADMISQLALEGVDVEWRYQLQVEDALLLGQYHTVVFADASHKRLPGGYAWNACFPASHYFYSSHMQSPETILYLCRELYHHQPEAFILAISGEEWDLNTELSPLASKNLHCAMAFFRRIMNDHSTEPVGMASSL